MVLVTVRYVFEPSEVFPAVRRAPPPDIGTKSVSSLEARWKLKLASTAVHRERWHVQLVAKMFDPTDSCVRRCRNVLEANA